MRILVTGAAGFIGSNTVKFLERKSNRVLAIDDFSTGKSENLKGFRGQILPCDVTDYALMQKAFYDFQPEAVLHLAAQSAISTSFSNPLLDLTTNVVGTLVLLDLSESCGVKRFVFASTSAVYSEKKSLWRVEENWRCEPTTPYGISKLACEQYIRLLFKNHAILRYGNVYGQGQIPIGKNQVVAKAFAHFVRGEPFQITGSGKQKRDFIHVKDIAFANLAALTSDAAGTFNVATGKSRSVNQVLGEIERIYEVVGYRWEHTQDEDSRGDVGINSEKFQRTFGWVPGISLESGLKNTADWWNNNK